MLAMPVMRVMLVMQVDARLVDPDRQVLHNLQLARVRSLLPLSTSDFQLPHCPRLEKPPETRPNPSCNSRHDMVSKTSGTLPKSDASEMSSTKNHLVFDDLSRCIPAFIHGQGKCLLRCFADGRVPEGSFWHAETQGPFADSIRQAAAAR